MHDIVLGNGNWVCDWSDEWIKMFFLVMENVIYFFLIKLSRHAVKCNVFQCTMKADEAVTRRIALENEKPFTTEKAFSHKQAYK